VLDRESRAGIGGELRSGHGPPRAATE
jgi:hypothetical protein